jgi:hypothetical protein
MTADFEFDFNMDDFSDVEFDLDTAFETRYIKPPKTKDIPENQLKYANAEKLAKEINLQQGERAFAVLNGSFYFGDFIEAFIVEKKDKVQELTISTLSMNENNVDSLANLLNWGCVEKLNLIVSDYFFSHERHNLIPYIYKKLDIDSRFQLAVAGTHCKIAQWETRSGKYYIIHGSANLRTSGNIEQIMIEESESLYKFNYDYQQRIIEKYKTIDHSVRNNELWETITK